ncbi:MAG: DNA-binding protein [Nitrospina sp.]|jgi:hypothetical protein|nr:DNA-binding protein [Nitrospina sp.]
MKQKKETILLTDITGEKPFLSGNKLGREVFRKLQDQINSTPSTAIFGISLKAISATDASFPRESVVSLIKLFAGEKGFYLKDLVNKDLIDNWDYAAKAKDQNVIVYQTGGSYVIIGPKLSDNIKSALDFVIEKGVATTSKIAKKFDVTPQNASARMKKLYDLGLVLCSKETAETGGPEFVYRAIK